MVRDGVILGDMLMALFAFPCTLKNPCRLFEYSGHFSLTVTSLPTPFNKSVHTNKSNQMSVRYIQTPPTCGGSISSIGVRSQESVVRSQSLSADR